MAITGNPIGGMGAYNEALAAVPDVTKRRSPGDGTEPQPGKGVKSVPEHTTADEDEREDQSEILEPGAVLSDAADGVLFKTVA